MSKQVEPMRWGVILMVMLGVGLVTGLLMGAISTVYPLSPSFTTSGVGAAVGVTGGLLMARRAAQNKALAESSHEDGKGGHTRKDAM
ncbi:MAG: hypothetical protein H6728_11765 [Myxococcales bacterium]|nr:hypothetical protein [Myxococcales bacterium]